MRAPRTLRGRLAAWYSAVLAVTLAAFAAAVYFFVDQDEDEPPRPVIAGHAPESIGRELLVALSVALPCALALAVVGGFWITRRTLKPLDEVGRVAAGLGAERLDERIDLPPDAAAEIQQLADVLNRMLVRLDRSVSGMRRFTADAAHELRTPLAALRGELEVTLRHPRNADEMRHTVETALGEVERLSELVEALLTLARSDGGELPFRREPLDVVEMVRRVLAPFEVVAADRELALACRGDGPVDVDTDARWLGRAVANLVDNACKFTPAGGRIDVEVVRANGAARITVSDTGPGIAADDMPRLFERFYRSRRTQGEVEGFGLGLALSRDVVLALGGTLTAQTRAPGGAAFVIELPAHRAAADSED